MGGKLREGLSRLLGLQKKEIPETGIATVERFEKQIIEILHNEVNRLSKQLKEAAQETAIAEQDLMEQNSLREAQFQTMYDELQEKCNMYQQEKKSLFLRNIELELKNKAQANTIQEEQFQQEGAGI